MNKQSALRKSAVVGFTSMALSMLAFSAQAVPLVMNGGLERPGMTDSVYINFYPPGDIPSWTVLGAPAHPGTFNAVYLYDDLTDAALPAYMPPSYYCAPALGYVGGNSCLNPAGTGHFINLDGDPAFPAAISQTIAGLIMGTQYSVTFDWAAVQRNDQTGPTSDYFLDVSLGGEHFLTSIDTGPLSLPSGGFSGWFTTSHTFTWDGTTSALTFLAHGLPSGLPPSINLDSVSMTAVPEPETLALLGIGLLGILAARRQQKKRV